MSPSGDGTTGEQRRTHNPMRGLARNAMLKHLGWRRLDIEPPLPRPFVRLRRTQGDKLEATSCAKPDTGEKWAELTALFDSCLAAGPVSDVVEASASDHPPPDHLNSLNGG